MPKPTKKALQNAVHAMRVYAGSGTRVHIRDAERLYARVQRTMGIVVAQSGLPEALVWEQVTAEATRQGYVLAKPGKDI